MAPTSCRACGNDISEDDVRCPHCGAINLTDTTDQRSWMAVILAPFVLILVTVTGFLVGGPVGAVVSGAAAFIVLFVILRRKF